MSFLFQDVLVKVVVTGVVFGAGRFNLEGFVMERY